MDTFRTPTLAEIVNLTDAELDLLLRQYGVPMDREEMLREAVRRAAGRLVGADNPDTALVDKVFTAAENAVRRELQNTAKAMTRQYLRRDLGVQADTVERWVAVDGAKHSCPSCVERHGEKQKHSDWVADGEPGSPNLICGAACLCELIPDDAFDGDYQKGDVQVEFTLEGEGVGAPVERQAGR